MNYAILAAGALAGLAATITLYWWTLNFIFRIPAQDGLHWQDGPEGCLPARNYRGAAMLTQQEIEEWDWGAPKQERSKQNGRLGKESRPLRGVAEGIGPATWHDLRELINLWTAYQLHMIPLDMSDRHDGGKGD